MATLITNQPLPFRSDTLLLWQSPHMTIGHTNWKVVVYEKYNALLDWTGKTGTARYTGYWYFDGADWKPETEHPRYNHNDGVYAGLPKGLRKLFYKHQKEIENHLQAVEFPMVEGEGAPQYTFDLAPETQLSLL